MPITDPNEVTAYLRACQDPGKLKQLQQSITERIHQAQEAFAAPGSQQRAYVQPLVHTGGLHQMPMTGPGPAPVMGTTTAEQALINQATFAQRAVQGRLPEQQSPARHNPIVTEGQGPAHLAQAAVGEGNRPLDAEAQERQDVMGTGGVQDAAAMGGDEALRTKALEEGSKDEGKKLRDEDQKRFQDQEQKLQGELKQQVAKHQEAEGPKQAAATPAPKPGPQPGPQPGQQPEQQPAAVPAPQPAPKPPGSPPAGGPPLGAVPAPATPPGGKGPAAHSLPGQEQAKPNQGPKPSPVLPSEPMKGEADKK
jgi:hypothetical protein